MFRELNERRLRLVGMASNGVSEEGWKGVRVVLGGNDGGGRRRGRKSWSSLSSVVVAVAHRT